MNFYCKCQQKKTEYQPIARWTAKAALFTVNDQMCKLWADTTPSMFSSDTFTLLYLMSLGVPSHKRQDDAINHLELACSTNGTRWINLGKNSENTTYDTFEKKQTIACITFKNFIIIMKKYSEPLIVWVVCHF